MTEFVFTISSWPPTVNHYYIIAAGSRNMRLKTSAANQWHRMAIIELRNQRTARGMLTLKVPVRVRLDLYAPDRVHFDIDNRAKPILDALQQAAVILDDDLVHELLMIKHIPPKLPGNRRKAEDAMERRGTIDIKVEAL